jgi:hypothetical protein
VFSNEPANVWVLQPPFVWLPAVMVLAALLGHIVIFRRIRAEKSLRKLAAEAVANGADVAEAGAAHAGANA